MLRFSFKHYYLESNQICTTIIKYKNILLDKNPFNEMILIDIYMTK